MPLIGNFTTTLKCPGRFLGNGSIEGYSRSNWGNNGSSKNVLTMACSAEAGFPDGDFSELNSIPLGYQMSGWLKNQKDGGMATTFSIAGTGSVSFSNLAGGYNFIASGAYSLVGTGNITYADAYKAINGSLSLATSGVLSASIKGTLVAVASIVATGKLTGNVAASLYAVASLVGTGRVTNGALLGAIRGIASILASGSITNANLAGKVETAASLHGSGVVSSIIKGIGNIILACPASGRISTANLVAKGLITLAIVGTGRVSLGNLGAKGSLSSDINVTGDVLTSATIADIVWGKVLDGTYTAEDLVKIIAAVSAGKSSGGPGSPVFRNLSDTTDRVSGIADSSGNRTSVTYDTGD